ncbi:hypothetical protein P153DRAFT_401160 [Dothidotthia symphoricarpi CBS 119687]|uniref:Mid2 domain-containing protein n=1 Tax=Dothidotthia symphoricarpi CBS 119687 TaxID=1392245 RepID=A0A6A6A0R8_9PLEO|nr:uncharacterized protein P153DRAFT_401160 [Dothidotthia symphoricarpi CBS 119687]KAF2124557.1 hypothetical protein P153DRAFT_401160 [Dothidotthia symphoricarpi CBS 119687]
MTGPLPIALLSAVAWAKLALGNAVPLVPADPTITTAAMLPRQNANNWIGWVEESGTWVSSVCDPGNTWYQNGQYAQCCPETNQACNAPTACVSGSQIYPFPSFATTTTVACTSNYNDTRMSICNTVFIFESFGDSNPKTDIVCGSESQNWSYYRKIPASATEAKTTQSSAAGSTTPSSSTSSSKTWIAGAVAGPVIGLALIALIFFCLRRRKAKKASAASAQGSATMATVDPSRPPPGVGGYTDAKPQFTTEQQGYYPPQQGFAETSASPPPQFVAPVTKYAYAPGAPELGGHQTMGAYAGHTPELAGQVHTAQPSELSGMR